MKPEAKIKSKLRQVIVDHGGYQFWPVQTGMGAATLDVFTCVYGSWFVIETKAPGKKPTPRQRHTADTIRAAGGVVFCIDSEEDVRKFDTLCRAIRNKMQKRVSQQEESSNGTAAVV